MYKPHRLLLDRASGYVAEASAYLRRRREARRPFARLYWPGGAGAAYRPDDDVGAALFGSAAELVQLSREDRRG